MASHNGQTFGDVQKETESDGIVGLNKSTVIQDGATDNIIVDLPEGTDTRVEFQVHIDLDHNGIVFQSYGDSHIYERIWFDPFEINAGFIVEDVDYTISVWNSYRTLSKSITSIVSSSPNGTLLTTDALPIVLSPTEENQQTLTVFEIGPPIQDTTYTYTIGGSPFVLEISGQRIIPWPYEPNWGENLDFSFNFKTTIIFKRRLGEQRRSLLNVGQRILRGRFLLLDFEMSEGLNTIKFGHDKIVGLPVYQERFTTTNTLTGQSTFTITEDVSDFYNLNNLSTFLIFVDGTGIDREVAIKELTSVVGQNVTLNNAITQTLDPTNTNIFPVMLSYFDSVDFLSETDRIIDLNITFKEFFNG